MKTTWLLAVAAIAAMNLTAQRPGNDLSAVWDHLLKSYDKDQDGKVSKVEYPRGDAQFANLDRDRDGVLTRADFGRRGGPRDVRLTIGQNLARAADADRDGEVTGEEWQTLLGKLAAGDTGAIAADRLLELLPRRGGRQARDDRLARNLVRALDRDGDGAVQTADLKAVFVELDASEDGTLQQDEVGAPNRRGGREARPALPKAGDLAPDFELPCADDPQKTVKLSSFAGKRPVALIFGSYT